MSVGALDLDEENAFFFSGAGGGTNKWKFVEFVGNVLSSHHPPTLHRLRLNCCSQNLQPRDWVIRTAVSRGVPTLDLCLQRNLEPSGKTGQRPSLLFMDLYGRAGQLPSLLLTSHSLVDLRLDLGGSKLFLPETMALIGLRRMHLRRVQFYENRLTRALFASSTALRCLVLEDCDYQQLTCFEISSSTLQELAFEDNFLEYGCDLGGCEVMIAAPQLSSFIYQASMASGYVVQPLLRVEYAKIQFQRFRSWQGMDNPHILELASSLFSSLSSARNLDMGAVFSEVLQCRGMMSLCLSHFRNLNVLRIAVKHLDHGVIDVVLSFLLVNPHLRALIVEVRDLSVLPSLAGKEHLWEGLQACLENGVVERVEIRCGDSSICSSREVIRYTAETVLKLVAVVDRRRSALKRVSTLYLHLQCGMRAERRTGGFISTGSRPLWYMCLSWAVGTSRFIVSLVD